MQQDKQIAATESDDGDSYKPVVVLTAKENMQQQDKQVAAAAAETEEVESNNNSKIIYKETRIFCSDGKYIDAEPLKRESLVAQYAYKFGVSRIKLNRVSELDSELILKVQIFCAVRANIQDDYANDETLARHKLNEFNSKFRQAHQKHALNFMIAAFELEIRSLVDTFMDDVIDIFLKMTDDEAYKILFVNMRDEYSNNVFKEYCERVMFHKWAFE
ncbi:uncharacterized protein [Rutidosis leptorrhynchoides]|uniref:uncharacterized protein n=1 Tax=Rutidosis leptorrhynchoides TaxID=125765 RepID=UPI003A98F2F4